MQKKDTNIKTMKRIFLTSTLLFLLLGLSGIAQEDKKYGDNPEQCKRDLSEFIEFVKQKNYLDAFPAWHRIYDNCPQSSKSIYIKAPNIFGALIKKNKKNPEVAAAYLDTLMQVYDKRIEYFGQKGSVLGRKANDLYRHNPKAYEQVYNILQEATSLSKGKTQIAVLQTLMTVSSKMYKNKKIDAGQVVADFSNASNYLAVYMEKNKDKAKKMERAKKVEENLGTIFVATGAGSCKVLVNHFTPKYEANPNDVELLKTITKYLDKSDCTDSELFFKASVSLYEASPSAQAAYNIARMASKKKNFTKAAEFYNKAIEMTDNDEDKAKYYYELAATVSSSAPAKARGYALKAANLKSGWGAPYLLIGQIYAGSASKCGEDKFTRGAVYWVAIDKFKKAKSVDPSCAKEANKLIATYKPYCPNKEDAFAYNITAGSTVKVECWINEVTKARF